LLRIIPEVGIAPKPARRKGNGYVINETLSALIFIGINNGIMFKGVEVIKK
jgi:hypothetical protein